MLVFKARPRKDPTLDAKLTNSERRIMRLYSKAMKEVRDEVIRDEGKILDAIMHRPIETVVNLVPVDPWLAMQRDLQEELLAELVASGQAVKLPKIQKATVTYRFDAERPEAAAWAEKEAGRLIVEVTQDQVNTVREYVRAASMGDYTPREVAAGLRDTIGLTTQQAGWVENFRAREIERLQTERGMSPSQAYEASERATSRYHDRIHRYRTETIARTEILRASHEGRRESWQQGIEQGFISPYAEKQWMTELDGRECEICGPLDGETVGINADFSQGEPPIHPNCRCTVILVPETIDADLEGLTDDDLESLIDDLLDGLPEDEQVSVAELEDPDAASEWTDGQRAAIDELQYFTNQMNMIEDVIEESRDVRDLRRGIKDAPEYFREAAARISQYTLDNDRNQILRSEEANFLLDNAAVVTGNLHRGMQASDEIFTALRSAEPGSEVDMRGVASFSRDPEIADMYASGRLIGGAGYSADRPTVNPVIMRTQGEVRGIPIEPMTEYGEEDEVLVRQNMRVVSISPIQVNGVEGLEIIVEQI